MIKRADSLSSGINSNIHFIIININFFFILLVKTWGEAK